MDEMENKLGAILNNPQMMQQIMSMAQALGAQQAPQEAPRSQIPIQENVGEGFPNVDLALLQKISGLAKQSSMEPREQALLRALGAYLTKERIGRLEKAMQAAKLAKLATTIMVQRGLLTGGR